MSEYVILDETMVKKYSVEVLKFFSSEDDLECIEIGDGNLNNVFRVVNKNTKKSLIIKQALPYARTSVEMILSAKRCKIEAMAIIEQGKYVKEFVPKVYNYDEHLCAMAMEDLNGYIILRDALMKRYELPNLANHAAIFFANTLIRTSDIVLDSKVKKDQVVNFINKDLCELTEELVLTQSTYECTRNKIDNHLIDFIKENVFNNKELEVKIAKLKYKFMNNAQALLHGDAHSGSIFVKEDSTKFFDTEFAFYGPMGFDVGMFVGNLIMDSCYQHVNNQREYNDKVIKIIVDFIDMFKIQFNNVWDEYASEYYAKKINNFKNIYLEEVLCDAAGYCGCEMIRRTIGSSHVKEMDEYKDKEIQKEAQIINVNMGVELIINADKFKCGEDYKSLLNKFMLETM